MRELLARKFAPGSELAARLLTTGDAPLVEGTTWGGRFRGVCRGEGQNWLGRLLMEQRDRLRRAVAQAGGSGRDGVEVPQFAAGACGSEVPGDGGTLGIALLLPGSNSRAHRPNIR
jgi:hypothetical protein